MAHFHRHHPYPTRATRAWRLQLTPAGWAALVYLTVLVGAVSAALYIPGG